MQNKKYTRYGNAGNLSIEPSRREKNKEMLLSVWGKGFGGSGLIPTSQLSVVLWGSRGTGEAPEGRGQPSPDQEEKVTRKRYPGRGVQNETISLAVKYK